MATLSIDPGTITGLISLVTSVATAVVTVIVAVRQTTTNRVIRRVEVQSNSMSERLQETAYGKGKAEEQVKAAAAVITQAASNQAVPKPSEPLVEAVAKHIEKKIVGTP
jgi:hypothetical protein